jgi:hypothetical protein
MMGRIVLWPNAKFSSDVLEALVRLMMADVLREEAFQPSYVS